MPLVRIDLRRGKSAAYKKAISDGVYQALREIFTVPENDRFMVVTDRADEDFLYESSYLGIDHGPDLVMLQIAVTNTRTVEQKQALYARIVELLETNPGIRKQDVVINLIEVGKENWSFGNGAAQYV
jgi:phenylpyruvate tautomerase PptA (4-oxalocrotonate tautomerase family)